MKYGVHNHIATYDVCYLCDHLTLPTMYDFSRTSPSPSEGKAAQPSATSSSAPRPASVPLRSHSTHTPLTLAVPSHDTSCHTRPYGHTFITVSGVFETSSGPPSPPHRLSAPGFMPISLTSPPPLGGCTRIYRFPPLLFSS